MVYRCIKPQCPTDCSECNHALPADDEAAMLVCDLLDGMAVNGFDQPLEDGESQLVDRARAWLATRRCASLPELPTCTKSQTDEIERLRTLAKDAYDAWQHDRDMRVGKLLLAMMDTKFSATYRPDLTPNA